jgi:Flp pilus assembly protein TadD
MIDNIVEIRNDHITEILQEGRHLFDEGDIARAKNRFETVIAADPQDFEALNNLGVIYFSEGNLQKAVSLFESALEFDGDYVCSCK